MSGGKMIRKLLILLCLLTLMLNGCASEKTKQTAAQENDTEEDSGEKKIQIGLTVDSFVIERWIRDRDAFVATARELGAEVNVQDAGADTKEQISQIDYFIKKHMDVIVIIAREFIISGFRLIAAENGVVIAANYWGKFKTVSQMIMIILLILNFDGFFAVLAQIFVWISIALTVISLLTYILQNKKVLSMQE